MEEISSISNLTKSLQMAANELNKARLLATQQGLQRMVSPEGRPAVDAQPADKPQEPAKPAPAQLHPSPKPRASSATRVRPSGPAALEAWPQNAGPASHCAGMQTHPNGSRGQAFRGAAPHKQQQQQQPAKMPGPVSLHSSVLNALPQQGPAGAARSVAGSVAGSTAPSLAATLGLIHRQLANASVPLKGSDAKDPKAWMMHNPKHSILQTQAKLNRLARLDKLHSKDQLLVAPLQQQQQQPPPHTQPAHALSPAGSAASVRQAVNPQQQGQQAWSPQDAQGSGKGRPGFVTVQGTHLLRPTPSSPAPPPRPPLLPHTHPQGGATGLAGPGAFQLHPQPGSNNAHGSAGVSHQNGGRWGGAGRGAAGVGVLEAHGKLPSAEAGRGTAHGALVPALQRPALGPQAALDRGREAGGPAQGRAGCGPPSQQAQGQAWVPPTESALRQLPVMPKPWGYQPVPSEAGSHADWWRGNRAASALGSVRSYPRTAVTDKDSVTPSELAAWEARMSNLEASINDEKIRRKKFEEELRQLEALAMSRGAITTGGIAVAKGPSAGTQQQQQLLKARADIRV